MSLESNRVSKVKYRVHFDYVDPLVDDAGNANNTDCDTTSDDTSKLSGSDDKQTGPGVWNIIDADELVLVVSYGANLD